ncbi:STAS domain-containing protein [Shewanella sp. D64]|uniref:STAS domain-containing protein n=1 Tax=unclassified Shewanella TaxID=196818 RepID=UPI0022BA6F88|nr:MULTISPECIES: STAS domain-containing protein [unclassified Shewanella]MEC4725629.1 STAS domain-containing protein [Shewanella sp. D64]MEC4739681.1 STAS domain-containing protein [Shewanella sp. E94]WBJ94856.1 STAS domain-containing protein [Shewanella sp. MTB7]
MADFIQQGSVCHISGRLSQAEVPALWLQRYSLLSKGVEVIDLSTLSYSDSAGIAFILELMSLARAEQRALSFVSPSEQLSKLIDLYDLELFFTARSNTR